MFLGVIAGVMTFAALDAASPIAIPTVPGIVCSIALAPAVGRLERSGASASLCAALFVGLLLGASTSVCALAPSAEAWNDRAPQILREVERRTRETLSGLSDTFDPGAQVAPTGETVPHQPEAPWVPGDDTVGRMVEGGQRLLAAWALGAPRLAAGAVFWAMLTFSCCATG